MVHFVWASVVVVALLAPIWFFKEMRQENRADAAALASGVSQVFRQDVTHHFVSSVSEVGEGRLLELAKLQTQETMTQTLTRSWLGFAAESTVRIEAPVIYRFGVRWDTGWEVTVAGDSTSMVCLVDAPALEPFQPPAIDTSGLRLSSREEFLAPSTKSSQEAMLRRFTPHVRELANTPEYRAIVRELARRTLVDYVQQWLLRSQLVDASRSLSVYARFADDAPDSLQSATLEYRTISIR
jgi:hypothetical protein